MHYYPRHLGDYAKDTGHLSLLEHGVYTLLLDWSYSSERPLPEDAESLYRLCRAMKPDEKRAVDRVVEQFFPISERIGRINKRVLAEIEKARQKSALASKAAHARHGKPPADAQRTHSGRTADGMPRARASTIQDPITNNQGGEAPPVGEGSGEVPTEADVLAFASGYSGNAAIGAPPFIPARWAADWFHARTAPGARPLGQWRERLVRDFERDFRNRHPKALPQKNGAAQKTARPPALPAWRQADVLKQQIADHPANRRGTAYCPDASMEEVQELAELRAALAALEKGGDDDES